MAKVTSLAGSVAAATDMGESEYSAPLDVLMPVIVKW
jgi:hypothetical protein